ncbi:exodeoxyribonuclease V subunit gamma [Klebsiella pneumoniae]|uniref:Exodeoxyribonuclease V subunit gamma n=1 Tax=Klebsiella pneumoniae TaxID=573 RepID=A0A2X3KL67_KLEPN|nr:exodeoxyribonuclease V subunit gamma [Klebsiella pneumoniae]
MSATRCSLLGQTGARLYLPVAGLERYEELELLSTSPPDNLLHNLQSDILELRNAAVAGQSRGIRHSRDKRRWRWMTAV